MPISIQVIKEAIKQVSQATYSACVLKIPFSHYITANKGSIGIEYRD